MAGISGLQLDRVEGRIALAQTAQPTGLRHTAHGRPGGRYAGITGVGEADGPATAQFKDIFSQALGLRPAANVAFIDADGQMQRAGGRGALLGDDEGSGFWIAREALAGVRRREDEAPGYWRDSVLACRLFEALGGSDGPSRAASSTAASCGAIGRLALVVAAAAAHDEQARQLLRRAGHELVRLALSLAQRYGPRPVIAAGGRGRSGPAIAWSDRRRPARRAAADLHRP